jgi:hypothetical protein
MRVRRSEASRGARAWTPLLRRFWWRSDAVLGVGGVPAILIAPRFRVRYPCEIKSVRHNNCRKDRFSIANGTFPKPMNWLCRDVIVGGTDGMRLHTA